MQHFRVRPIGDLRQQLGVVDRFRLDAARQRKAQLVEHGAEAGDAVVAGTIVIAEQRRLLVLLDKARRRDVGEDHALFDQLVRVVAHGALYALDTAFRVEDKLRFFGLERDAAARLARLFQHLIHVVQLFQRLHQRCVLFAQLRVALQDIPHFVIGESRMGVHYRFIVFEAGQLACGGDSHLAHHAETIDLRVERAEPVGEHFRQHRHYLRREVDRGAALQRFVVQRRAGTHIVADVGNGYP